MGKTLRYLLRSARVNLVAILAFAAIVTVGAMVTEGRGLFEIYFTAFPLMALMILFMVSFARYTSNLNIALSFGGRRKAYFWASHLDILVCAAAVTVLQVVMIAIAQTFPWVDSERWTAMLTLNGRPVGLYFLLALVLQLIGSACGLLMVRSKAVGLILMMVVMLFSIASVVFLMLSVNHHWNSWGDLPWILSVILTLMAVVSEVYLWKTVHRYSVR